MNTRLSIFYLWLCIPWLVAATPNSPTKMTFTYNELSEFRDEMMPLLDLIASGEGNYTSVNRGRAGDSPGDWPKDHLGKSITEMSIKEIRQHQGGKNPDCWYNGKKGRANLFAVGRYQLIPCTLQYATIAIEDLDVRIKYTPEVQDTFGVFLLLVKRPIIRDYLAGIHNDHKEAGQELAKEFASVPIQYSNERCKRGQSYYCGDKAGNKAHISLKDVDAVLKSVRQTLQQDGELYALITGKKIKEEKQKQPRISWWKRLFRKDSGLHDSPIASMEHTIFDALTWTGTPTNPHVTIEYIPIVKPEPLPPIVEPTRERDATPPQPPPQISVNTPTQETTATTSENTKHPPEDIDDPRIIPTDK